jgi:hypothetical protein
MLILRELKGGKPLRLRHIPLSGALITFGRSPACTFQLEKNPHVSRTQATLKRDVDGWWLTDGSIDARSTAGVYVGGRRIDRPVQLTPGLKVSLFWSPDYQADLEVLEIEVDEAELDHPTDQVDLRTVQIGALQSSVEQLSWQVQQLTNRVDQAEMNQTSAVYEVVDRLDGKIDAVAAELLSVHHCNSKQDKLIRNAVIGLAAALITVCTHQLADGKAEVLEKAFSAFGVVLGGGGIAAVVAQQSQKSSESSRTDSPQPLTPAPN